MVGFYHAGESELHRRLADRLVASVRRSMPGVIVTHFSDEITARIDCDSWVITKHGPTALRCVQSFEYCEDDDWVFVDTDIEIRSDVRGVFDDPDFDIAVATREGTYSDERDQRWSEKHGMPFNKGVVFSRCPEFWRAAGDHCATLGEKQQQWMGDQIAVNHVIASGQFKVKVLPNIYNYPPKSKTDDVRDKAILHFKGPRKAWALEGCFA